MRNTDKHDAAEWALDVLRDDNVVILDSETSDMYGEIIELAIIDVEGNVLMNQRIRPQGDIAPGAQRIHGITLDDLANQPTFDDVYDQIKGWVEGRRVVIYNANYDIGHLRADCDRHGLTMFDISSDCAMEWYAQWYGEWNDYHGNYRWQRLNGDHSALGDCKATLERIKSMSLYLNMVEEDD